MFRIRALVRCSHHPTTSSSSASSRPVGRSLFEGYSTFHAMQQQSYKGRQQLAAVTQMQDEREAAADRLILGTDQMALDDNQYSQLHSPDQQQQQQTLEFPSQRPVGVEDASAVWSSAGRLSELQQHKSESDKWQWDQRCAQFSRAQRQIHVTITSHLSIEDKCFKLLELFRDVKTNRLHLRAQTYEDMFEVFLSMPFEKDKPFAFLDAIFEMYHYMKGTFAAPSQKILEYLMCALARFRIPSAQNESRAHKLLLDSEKFTVMPTRATYTAYFDVCGTNNVMHIAVARFVDVRQKLGMQPDEGMCTVMIRGLVKNGQVEEAVAFISNMYAVPVDVFLMDAVLEALAQSRDPMAAFTAYRSMLGSGVTPSAYTFWYMMLACEKSDLWDETPFVLEQMHRLGIRGNAATLNLVIKGLLTLKQTELAHKMYLAMKRKRLEVWEALENAMPIKIKDQASMLLLGDDKKRIATSELQERALKDYASLKEGNEKERERGEGFDRPKPVMMPSSIVPRDEAHLKEIATLSRLRWVHDKHLLHFLKSKDIRVHGKRDAKSGKWSRPSSFAIQNEVHKYFFGVTIPSKATRNVLPGAAGETRHRKIVQTKRKRAALSRFSLSTETLKDGERATQTQTK
eukprot:PhM_4_TR15635/c0_g1_i1/m.78247